MKSKALAVLILASLMYGLTGAVNAYKAGAERMQTLHITVRG